MAAQWARGAGEGIRPVNRNSTHGRQELDSVDTPPDDVPPDTEQNVIDQTEDVFMNFMYQSWRQDKDKEQFTTPSVPQFANFTSEPLSKASQVGRQLAKIGDDVNRKYQKEFDDMIDGLNINKATAYEAFAGIGTKLMEGGLNWGRILTLFSFGYRVAIRVLGIGKTLQDLTSAIRSVVANMIRFVKDKAQGIAQWVASQGGWTSALNYVPTISWQVWTGICISALATVGAVLYLRS